MWRPAIGKSIHNKSYLICFTAWEKVAVAPVLIWFGENLSTFHPNSCKQVETAGASSNTAAF
jgi:hypothetical protein